MKEDACNNCKKVKTTGFVNYYLTEKKVSIYLITGCSIRFQSDIVLILLYETFRNGYCTRKSIVGNTPLIMFDHPGPSSCGIYFNEDSAVTVILMYFDYT